METGIERGLTLPQLQLGSFRLHSGLRNTGCVTVWAIAADNSKEAAELRALLVKLSGRQMRHKKEFTNPALLAGLWLFLSMLEIMGAHSQEELDSLKTTAQQFLGKVV
jgi:hypothetical protein